MTTEEKFNAAVNVIRSLPKNGSYQPSHELMLRFYAYFKQATQGPCKGPRPPFWDIVGKTKYDAYKALGNMSKQNAMEHYVNELHRIVETMSYSDKVANFLEAPPSELDSLNMADLELIVGDVMERVRSQTNSPVVSRETSPVRLQSSRGMPSDIVTSQEETDHSDEEYIDSVDVPESKKILVNGSIHHELLSSVTTSGHKEHKSRLKTRNHSNIDISKEVSQAINSLRSDIDKLRNKVDVAENSIKSMKLAMKRQPVMFDNLSPKLLTFILIWPFIATFVMHRFLYRK